MSALAWLVGALLLSPARAAGVPNIEEARALKKAALQKVTQRYEEKIRNLPRAADGTLDVKSPEYAKLKDAWRREMGETRSGYDLADERWDNLQAILKKEKMTIGEHGAGADITNSGSVPKSLNSDMDVTPKDYATARKYRKALKEAGYTVEDWRAEGGHSDRWVVKENDQVIWLVDAGKPTSDNIGGSAYEARVTDAAKAKSDMYPTAEGVRKAAVGGDVPSNLKKFSDGELESDWHVIGKSVSKAMKAAGTQESDPEFMAKAQALREHMTTEEADIVTLGASPEQKAAELRAFKDQARDKMREAYQKSMEAQAGEIRDLNGRATALRESGNSSGAKELREQAIQLEVDHQATINQLARDNPDLVAHVTGSDPRTPAGAETLAAASEHAAVEATEPVEKPAFNAPVETAPGPEPGGRPAVEKAGEPRGPKGERVEEHADVLGALAMAGSFVGGAEDEYQDAVKHGRDPSRLVAAALGAKQVVYDMTGIPMALGTKRQYDQLYDEYMNRVPPEERNFSRSLAARTNAVLQIGRDMTQFDAGTEIANEEIQREERQAAAEHRDPSYTMSALNGAARGIGSVIQVARIAEFYEHDWGADLTETRQGLNERAWAHANLEQGLQSIKDLQSQIQEANASSDPNEFALRRLAASLDKERQALSGTAEALKNRFGADDPEVTAALDAVGKLPEGKSVTDALDHRQSRADLLEAAESDARGELDSARQARMSCQWEKASDALASLRRRIDKFPTLQQLLGGDMSAVEADLNRGRDAESTIRSHADAADGDARACKLHEAASEYGLALAFYNNCDLCNVGGCDNLRRLAADLDSKGKAAADRARQVDGFEAMARDAQNSYDRKNDGACVETAARAQAAMADVSDPELKACLSGPRDDAAAIGSKSGKAMEPPAPEQIAAALPRDDWDSPAWTAPMRQKYDAEVRQEAQENLAAAERQRADAAAQAEREQSFNSLLNALGGVARQASGPVAGEGDGPQPDDASRRLYLDQRAAQAETDNRGIQEQLDAARANQQAQQQAAQQLLHRYGMDQGGAGQAPPQGGQGAPASGASPGVVVKSNCCPDAAECDKKIAYERGILKCLQDGTKIVCGGGVGNELYAYDCIGSFTKAEIAKCGADNKARRAKDIKEEQDYVRCLEKSKQAQAGGP